MTSEKLPLKSITFGKTDAYNELLEYGIDRFAHLFLSNNAYDIEGFINGSKYYIYGGKGTGKTAFLKYLECILAGSPENLVIPIRYKSEFDSDDKKDLLKASITHNIHEEVIDTIDFTDTKDCIVAWQLYLISRIVKGLKNERVQIFDKSKDYSVMTQLITSIYSEQSHRIVPKINKGHVSANLSMLKGLSAEVELEIGLEKEQKRVNYQKLAKKVIELFGTLNKTSSLNKVWILFDELELSVHSQKMNKRDIELVRDLILAVERLNDLCRRKCYPIHIIASIRSEVINSVYSSGFEINKPIEDFGKEISWYIRGGSYSDSPLIAMVEHRIRASEEDAGIYDSGDLWGKYFPPTINDMDSKEYILRYTWHRPRDVVRMLSIAQDSVGDAEYFSQDIFDKIMRDYSEKSWNEIAEDLSLIYSGSDLKSIKKLFTNIAVPFTFSDLNTRLDELGKMYDFVADFQKRHQLINVIDQLFEAGVLGNSGQRMLFKFLKDSDLDVTGKMIIHVPLRNYFAVQSALRQK